jgi:hypothetical protein
MSGGVIISYRYDYTDLSRYQYILAGIGSLALSLLFRQFLGFSNKEDMILDSLTDHMDNHASVAMETPKTGTDTRKKEKDKMIAQVTEGIKQTAASGNKFSHLLTPEEEDIMRDVIKEYLS